MYFCSRYLSDPLFRSPYFGCPSGCLPGSNILISIKQCRDALAVLILQKNQIASDIENISGSPDEPVHPQVVALAQTKCTDEILRLTMEEAALNTKIKKLQQTKPINRWCR